MSESIARALPDANHVEHLYERLVSRIGDVAFQHLNFSSENVPWILENNSGLLILDDNDPRYKEVRVHETVAVCLVCTGSTRRV